MNALQTLLLQMACNLRNSRPECSQLLSTFNEWSIDNSIVKQHSNFQTTITRLKQFHCQFFYKYLSYKLRDPRKLPRPQIRKNVNSNNSHDSVIDEQGQKFDNHIHDYLF
jgi:hypothetical protein